MGLTPDEQFAVAVDLGTDGIYTYKKENGKLELAHTFETKPGTGLAISHSIQRNLWHM